MKKYEHCINVLYILQMQFDQMASCIKMLDSVMLSQRYRKHRPSVSIRQDPRAWWKYAYTCIAVTRQTWSTMLQRAKVLIWKWRSNNKGSWLTNLCIVPLRNYLRQLCYDFPIIKTVIQIGTNLVFLGVLSPSLFWEF